MAGINTPIGNILSESSVGEHVYDLMMRASQGDLKTGNSFAYDVVAGAVGADVLDYIDRDSQACGLEHRIDTAIFRQFRMRPDRDTQEPRLYSGFGGKHGPRQDSVFAIESLYLARFALFLKVYTHHTKLAWDGVLSRAVSALKSGGKRSVLRESDFESVGDEGLLRRWASFKTRPRVVAAAQRILGQDPPEGVYKTALHRSVPADREDYQDSYAFSRKKVEEIGLGTPEERERREREIAKRAGIDDADRVYLYASSVAPGYRLVDHLVAEGDGDAITRETEIARKIAQRHLGIWHCWVFLADGDRRESEAVALAAEDTFALPNELDVTGVLRPPTSGPEPLLVWPHLQGDQQKD
jgi:HD superfamily phosphohydrolase